MMVVLIGAVLGFVLLHSPIGALAGGAVGWMVSAGMRRRPVVKATGDFVAPMFAVLGAVAKSDGRVSEAEIAVAERLMVRLGLDAQHRHWAINAFNQGKQPGFDTDDAMRRLRQWTEGRRGAAIPVLDVVVETVLAEGPSEAKLRMLRQLADTLHVSQMQLMALMAMRGYGFAGAGSGGAGGWWHGGSQPPHHQAIGPDPYVILGVAQSADERTVKRAYRKLISTHHPDRLGDLPDDLRERAEQRAGEINAAYERIKAERGFK